MMQFFLGAFVATTLAVLLILVLPRFKVKVTKMERVPQGNFWRAEVQTHKGIEVWFSHGSGWLNRETSDHISHEYKAYLLDASKQHEEHRIEAERLKAVAG